MHIRIRRVPLGATGYASVICQSPKPHFTIRGKVIPSREPNALASGIHQFGSHSEAPEASAYGSRSR